MIETKEQVLTNFREKAREFLDHPTLMSGIDFDDASVTLKRFVLTELRDVALGSRLAEIPHLIRSIDVESLKGLVAEVDAALSE